MGAQGRRRLDDPQGRGGAGEDEHAAALREFAEELGVPAPAAEAPDLDLGTVRQRAGKLVAAWARGGPRRHRDLQQHVRARVAAALGTDAGVPELDRAGWFPLARARGLVVAGQVPLLDRLEELLAREPAQSTTTEG